MRILYITTSLKSGGAERVVCKLADNYSSRGHTVAIVSLIDGFEVIPKNKNIYLYSLDIRKNSIWSMVRGLYKALIYVVRFRADVVHSHMYHANIFARFLNILFFKQKLICTAHDHIEGGALCDFLYRITDYIPYISTNVSISACQDFFTRKASTPTTMIPVYNGIDVKRFYKRYKPNRSPARLLSVGRLAPKKNLGMIINALKLASDASKENIELWIVGTGPEFAELSELVGTLGMSERVSFLGEIAEPEKLMSEVTLFISTSNYEGFGLAIAEAMASGVPIIVTDCGGAAEVVGDSKYLVPIGDVDALAKMIVEKLGLSDDALVKLGGVCRERIETFFSDQVEFQIWDRLYSHEENKSMIVNDLSRLGLAGDKNVRR